MILPIIILGISAAIITSLSAQVGVYNRVSDSHDAQLTSTYFVPDVENAVSVSTSWGTSSAAPCVTFSAPTQLVELGQEIAGNPYQVYYVYGNANIYLQKASNQNALLRIVCSGSSLPPTTVVPDPISIVAHSVSSASVTVTCLPTSQDPPTPANWPWPPWTPCNTVTGNGGSGPTVENVQLQVLEQPTASPGTPNPGTQLDSFTYNLTATPRTQVPYNAGGAPLNDLVLLGPTSSNSSCSSSLLCFMNPVLSLTIPGLANNGGTIDDDSNAAGSIAIATGGDTINAAAGTGSGVINVLNCTSISPNGCAAVSNDPSAISPWPPISISSAYPDPLSSLSPPGFIAGPSQSCSGGSLTANNQTLTCPAGLYSSGLTISGNSDIITFTGGGNSVYQFGPMTSSTPSCNSHTSCGLFISGTGDTISFQSSEYIFGGGVKDNNSCTGTGMSSARGGINISGNNDAATSGAGGVFFYVAGGAADFGCATTGDSFSLSPESAGTYAGVLLFGVRSPNMPRQVILNGVNTTGAIYASGANVSSYGTGTNTTGPIIAIALNLFGSLHIQ